MRRAWLALLLVACAEERGPEALLRAGARALEFGQVPVGRSHTRRVAVHNDGARQLQISAVKIDRGPFAVFPSAVAVSSGESVELRVRFEPDAIGPFEGTLSFESNDARGSTVTVALLGAGACSGVGCAGIDAGTEEDAAVRDAEGGDAVAADAELEDAAMDAGVPGDAAPEDATPIDTGADAGTPGLAAYYRFEETSGALIDGSGNGNDGVPSSAGLMRGVPGKIGSAVRFEGSVGQFLVPADPTLDGIGALSIELWINVTNTGVNQTIVSRGLNTGGDGVFLTTQCNNVHVAFSRSGVTGSANATSSCNSFPENQWVHVAVVNDGLFLTLYLDGQEVAENVGGFLGPIASPLYLGRKEPGVEPLTGLIDELTWWTVARTHAEVCSSAGGSFAGGACTLP